MDRTMKRPASYLNILLNPPPLLMAALAIMITCLTLFLASAPSFPSFGFFIAVACSLLILIYAAYEFVRQVVVTLHKPYDLLELCELCMSAFVGCSLLGVASFLLTSTITSRFIFSGPALLLSTLPLLFLVVARWRLPRILARFSDSAGFAEQNQFLNVEPKQAKSGALPSPYATNNAPAQGIVSSTNDATDQETSPLVSVPEELADPLNYTPTYTSARFFTVTKGNDAPHYNEDACVISLGETRFALCDGASGSELPRAWAHLLGEQWIEKPLYNPRGIPAPELTQWLEGPRKLWTDWVRNIWWHNVNVRHQLSNTPLITSEKIESILYTGAAATFLGLDLDRCSMTWKATAVGDTCLFHVRWGGSQYFLIPIMPLKESNLFTQSPFLLGTQFEVGSDRSLLTKLQCMQAPFHTKDLLLMATDALAQWLIVQTEANVSEWTRLLLMQTQQEFQAFVDEQRYRGNMVDDDTTLVVIPC